VLAEPGKLQDLHMSRRSPLPEAKKQKVLYLSAFACAVCQYKADHIHHINKDSSDNGLDNLVALCQKHHDEAHTTSELSQNLTTTRIKKFRNQWYYSVDSKRERIASVRLQRNNDDDHFISSFASWGYINHRRVAELSGPSWRSRVTDSVAQRCLDANIIDQRGVVIQPSNWHPSEHYVRNTIYDWFNFGDDQTLHLLYSELVDSLSERTKPVHLNSFNWNRRFIDGCIKSGRFIFLTKDFYFKKEGESRCNARVRARAFKRNISVEFYLDTRDMFGTTSITCSFSGHKSCAAFLLVKSVERDGAELVLHSTPIALGIGLGSALSTISGAD